MPYAGESARSSARTRRTTASMSSKPVGGDDTMDDGIGQEKGAQPGEWPKARGGEPTTDRWEQKA